MKKLLSLLTFAFFTFNSFAVISSDDIQTANYLASKKIIKDWSSEPKNYRFDDYIARSEIMGMVLAMTNVTRNTTCRGDFADVPKSNTDWVCRTIETAADKGYINAQASLSKANRKARPYDHITRAEALGILMKAVKDEGGWAGYSYYWSSSLPNPDSTTGYKDIYSFGAEWQAWVFYDYIKKVLEDDKQLYINPRANDRATRREVFDFAATIDKKINNNSSLVNTSNIDLDISFNAPSDAVVSTAKSRKTIDGISINELIVTPLGVDATSVYFFTSYASFDEVKNIHIYSSNIKSSSFYDTTVAGYKGVRRVDKYLNNDCTDETTVVEKAGVIYGYTMALCPTHPAGYDQIRKDIANSLSFL